MNEANSLFFIFYPMDSFVALEPRHLALGVLAIVQPYERECFCKGLRAVEIRFPLAHADGRERGKAGIVF